MSLSHVFTEVLPGYEATLRYGSDGLAVTVSNADGQAEQADITISQLQDSDTGACIASAINQCVRQIEQAAILAATSEVTMIVNETTVPLRQQVGDDEEIVNADIIVTADLSVQVVAHGGRRTLPRGADVAAIRKAIDELESEKEAA